MFRFVILFVLGFAKGKSQWVRELLKMWCWDYATIYFVNILGMPCSFLSIFLEKKSLENDEPLDDFYFFNTRKIHFAKVFSKFSLKIAKGFHPKKVKTLVRTWKVKSSD
jgi:hypothetical protein